VVVDSPALGGVSIIRYRYPPLGIEEVTNLRIEKNLVHRPGPFPSPGGKSGLSSTPADVAERLPLIVDVLGYLAQN